MAHKKVELIYVKICSIVVLSMYLHGMVCGRQRINVLYNFDNHFSLTSRRQTKHGSTNFTYFIFTAILNTKPKTRGLPSRLGLGTNLMRSTVFFERDLRFRTLSLSLSLSPLSLPIMHITSLLSIVVHVD